MKLVKIFILMYISLCLIFSGGICLGYGFARNQIEYKILNIDLTSTSGSYIWWDKLEYHILATTEIVCDFEDVLRTRTIIKPDNWKGYDAELFVFFKAVYASEPIGVQSGEDVKCRRAGQIFIGDETEVSIWLASPLSLQEMEEKNYFGNWSIELERTHRVYGDLNLKILGGSLTFIGTISGIIPLLQVWREKSKLEKLNHYL